MSPDDVHPLDTAAKVPHELEAERALLGALLADETVFAHLPGELGPLDFYREIHGLIYGAAQAVARRGQAVTSVTVAAELGREQQLAVVGGPAYLSELAASVGSPSTAASYAALVREAADKRRLVTAAGQILQIALNGRSAQAAYDQAQQLLATLAPKACGVSPERAFAVGDLLREVLAPVPYVVAGILPQGVTLFAGKPKQGKSFLSLGLAIAVAAGIPALGDLPVLQGEVLYLCLEGGRIGLASRLRTMLAGRPAPPDLYCATEWPRLDEGGAEEIEAWLQRHRRARLVIVDTLQRIRAPSSGRRSAYEEDYQALQPLNDLAQRYPIALPVVHHTRKAGADDVFETISGTTGLAGAVDSSWVLQRVRGQDSAVLAVTGRNVVDQELGLQWDQQTLCWRHSGSGADAKRSAERRQILDALMADGGGPLSAREVADLLDTDYNVVRKMLWRMERTGELHKDRNGYVIPLP